MSKKTNHNYVRGVVGNLPKMTDAAASAELTDHFESRPPKPPGVTVKVRFYPGAKPDLAALDPELRVEGYWDWTAFLDGVDADDACVWSERQHPTPEDAEKHCRGMMALLIERLYRWKEAKAYCLDINFVRE